MCPANLAVLAGLLITFGNMSQYLVPGYVLQRRLQIAYCTSAIFPRMQLMKQWKPFSQGHNMCLLVGIGERAESVKGKVNSCPIMGQLSCFTYLGQRDFMTKKEHEEKMKL